MQANSSSTPPEPTPTPVSTPGTTPGAAPAGRLARTLRSRWLLGGLVALTATAVAGTTVAYASMSTTVALSVDGEQREVTALASTVGDVLESEGVEVGPRDIVAPSADEEIEEGTAITVRYARQLELVVDGEEESHWVTATSVSGALAQVGTDYRGADLSTSRSMTIGRDGASLDVVTPKKLTLALAGKKPVTKQVTALRVSDALEQLDVEVDKSDEVTPKPSAVLEDGDKIVFTDVRVATERDRDQVIEAGTTQRDDPDALEGRTTTVRSERDGVRDVTYRVVYRNGDEASREVVRSSVVREPVAGIVAIGTREPEPRAGARAGARRPGQQLRRRQHRVGPARAVRVRRQLGHQHRQRLLRRSPVQPGDLAVLRRYGPAQRQQPRVPDRGGRAAARRDGRVRLLAVLLLLAGAAPVTRALRH